MVKYQDFVYLYPLTFRGSDQSALIMVKNLGYPQIAFIRIACNVTSPISGCRSVGIVSLRTMATELVFSM
jgi:hypothetical protein